MLCIPGIHRLDHTKVISSEKKSTNFISGRCFRTSFSLNPAPKNIFITPLRFQQTLTHSQPLSLATLSVIACRRFDFHKHRRQNNVAALATNQINLYFPFSANSFPSSSPAFPPFPRVQSLRAASQTWSLPRGHQPTQPTPILLSSRSFLLHLQVPRRPLEGGEMEPPDSTSAGSRRSPEQAAATQPQASVGPGGEEGQY